MEALGNRVDGLGGRAGKPRRGSAAAVGRLRVAMIAPCPFPANHGTPGGIREKVEALHDLGHEVHVITYAAKQGDQVVRGAKIHRIPAIGPTHEVVVGPTTARMYWDALLTFKVISVVRRYKIDIMHGMNYEGAMAGAIAKMITGCPLLYGAVNTMIDELPSYKFMPPAIAKPLAKMLDNTVPRLADRVVCYTPMIKEFLVRAGVPAEKVDVIKLGIDLSMFADAEPGNARARMNVNGDPLVVYTGVLNKFQRIDYLLQAMRIVLDEMPTAKLAFVRTLDDEQEKRDVERMAKEERVDHAILFPEVITLRDLPSFIAAADATAVPRPDCPGVPVKLLNFMAAGKAVVVTQGSSQGLRDGVETLVTEDHNPTDMGQALLRVLRDKELASRLGQQARAVAYAEYDRMATTGHLVESYVRAIKSSGKRLPNAVAEVAELDRAAERAARAVNGDSRSGGRRRERSHSPARAVGV